MLIYIGSHRKCYPDGLFPWVSTGHRVYFSHLMSSLVPWGQIDITPASENQWTLENGLLLCVWRLICFLCPAPQRKRHLSIVTFTDLTGRNGWAERCSADRIWRALKPRSAKEKQVWLLWCPIISRHGCSCHVDLLWPILFLQKPCCIHLYSFIESVLLSSSNQV